MIKRIKCKTCGDKRDMLESGDHFICTSCGTIYDLNYIADSFYTPLLIEISYLIQDLDELSSDPNDGSDEDADAPEFEIGDSDELDPEDAELTDEDFWTAEEISPIEKAKSCLSGYLYRDMVENDPDSASAFLDTVLRYDKNNIIACLIKALEDTWDIPQYTISITGDMSCNSLDTLPFSFGGKTDVTFDQELFVRMSRDKLVKHLQSILNLLLTSVQNAPSENLCAKAYRIASTLLDLYGVFLRLNALENLKVLPLYKSVMEYFEYRLAIGECQGRLKRTATARLTELGDPNTDLPDFHDFFPETPNWACCLAETEYRTAEEIWEKMVVSHVDRETGQVSKEYLLQMIDPIFVVRLLLGQYMDVDAAKVAGLELRELQILQKMVKKLSDVYCSIKSFHLPKLEDAAQSLVDPAELEKFLSFIDEELSKRL